MSEVLIVGGGIAGLAVAKVLKGRGIAMTGLEREPKIGGRLDVGHHRLYTTEARDLLTDLLPGTEWDFIDEDPVQIRKGEIGTIGDDFLSPEQFYLKRSFYLAKQPYGRLISRLVGEVGSLFRVRMSVSEVNLEKREVTCQTGEVLPYRQLIWTSSFAGLLKSCGQTPKVLAKGKKSAPLETGGMTWDFHCEAELFPHRNTVVFPFRYKDLKLRALGVRGPTDLENAHAYHWMLFLEDSLLENREELAKVVRAFKRDLMKQFPVLVDGLRRERLVFHSSLSGEEPVAVSSIEVFDGVVCLGPDIQTEAVSPTAERNSARNLDAVLLNCLDFVDIVLPQWTSPEARAVESAPEAHLEAPAP